MPLGIASPVAREMNEDQIVPASQRTPEWRKAMLHFTDKEILVDSDNRAKHLFGDFYEIGTDINELKGG